MQIIGLIHERAAWLVPKTALGEHDGMSSDSHHLRA